MKLTSLLSWGAAALALSGAANAQFVIGQGATLGTDDGEITPDGRYGVLRENGWEGAILVFDMASGQMVDEHRCDPTGTGFSSVNEDGVAVTNERAIVIGNCALIADLTAVGTPGFIIGHHDVGLYARDVAITPDGSVAAVRGGSDVPGKVGGLFLFDLQTGGLLATAPGQPPVYGGPQYSSDLDSVAVTDEYAVFTSLASSSPPRSRVTIFALKTDGPPVIAFETSAAAGPDQDMVGAPNDLAVMPDGGHVVLRSEFELALIELAPSGPQVSWRTPMPGLLNQSMDTVEVTETRIATISCPTLPWGQVDVFDLAGRRYTDSLANSPHDLAITPSGDFLLVRWELGVSRYDLRIPPRIGAQLYKGTKFEVSTHTGWQAGLDSIEVTDDRAAALFRNGQTTSVQVIDLEAWSEVAEFDLADEPTDLALTPDGTRLVVAGLKSFQVFDLRSNTITLSHKAAPGSGGYVPWSDGVVADDDHALAWGAYGAQQGWISVVDLFSQPASSCAGFPNSVGQLASTHATGSASVASNELTVWGTGLPASTPAMLVYGDGTQTVPFGHGYSCVAGTTYRFAPSASQADGIFSQPVDVNGSPQMGGAITSGSTWNFQVLYVDGRIRSAADALTITFVP